MKKFIALALAILMMAAIAVPVMAEETKQMDTNVASQTTQVKFGTQDGYVVTVPAIVDFQTALETTTTISATQVIIPGNQVLKVKLASSTEGGKTAFTMVATNGSDPVAYEVALEEDGDALENDDVVLTVVSNQTGMVKNEETQEEELKVTLAKDQTLYFSTAGTTQSGQYSDTLTFTAFLDNAQ